MLKETKSNWSCVADGMKDEPRVSLGRYASYWFHRTPRRMLHSLAYYKFAAKLIGSNKSVLDIGCNEGLGTVVLAKECGNASGIDFDKNAIDAAQKNFAADNLEFIHGDIFEKSLKTRWDAVVNFDVIEHIYEEHVDGFIRSIQAHLKDHGIAVFGTPSLISQNYASEVSKKGHVNIYSPERLEEELSKYFSYVFLFSANDEVVHTGFPSLAHYLIAVCCKKK